MSIGARREARDADRGVGVAGPTGEASMSEVARAAATGRPEALEELLRRTRQLALRYARARLGRFDLDDLAQDVAQEVCLAVYAGLPGFEDRGAPFEAFVYAISARKVADVQRAVLRSAIPVADLPEAADGAPGPDDLVLSRSQATLALSLIDTLPGTQREILALRLGAGLGAAQTAAVLGMTEGAVRVAQHRALTRLRADLTALDEGGVA